MRSGDEAIGDAVRLGLARHGIVGASLARITSRGIDFQMHVGFADRERRRVPNSETLYDWGSITKLFCGIALMQLRDRGRVDLRQPAVRYLPALAKIPSPYPPYTLEHLLSHTSGLQDASTPDPHTLGTPWPLWPEIEAGFPRLKVEAPPGQRYEYSNLGIMLVGRIVELLTRDEWESHVTKNILMPLEMREAYFDQTPYHLVDRRAESYTADGKPLGLDVDHGATTSNGGLKASITDMSRFARFLIEGGGPLLSKESLAEMMRPRFAIGEGRSVGLAFHHEPYGGRTLIGHGGSSAGFRAWIYLEPVARQALLFAANTETAKALFPDIARAFCESLKPPS